jgi:hypothetical protein
MITTLLIFHALVGVTLLGAITHQSVSMLRRPTARTGSFIDRYTGVGQKTFTIAIVSLFATNVLIGAILYPTYRLNVRIPFEEMRLAWAVGLFEVKEHFAGIGLAMLPAYAYVWRTGSDFASRNRMAITLVIAFIVWWDFIVGHVLNNLRGLA